MNELLYGLMVNAVGGHKNPAGASVYGSIAGNAWYRAQYNLQDMKIGHYMHIPPKAVFFSQVFGSFLGIPINYAVVRWVLDTKFDYLTGAVEDPTHQWTAQSLASNLTMGVQYVLIVCDCDIFKLSLFSLLIAVDANYVILGTSTAFRHGYLPSASIWLLSRNWVTNHTFRIGSTLPEDEVSTLEYNYLLCYHGPLLRQH